MLTNIPADKVGHKVKPSQWRSCMYFTHSSKKHDKGAMQKKQKIGNNYPLPYGAHYKANSILPNMFCSYTSSKRLSKCSRSVCLLSQCTVEYWKLKATPFLAQFPACRHLISICQVNFSMKKSSNIFM